MTVSDVRHEAVASDQLRPPAPASVLPGQPQGRERVEKVLPTLPSHGETAGRIDRRDRKLDHYPRGSPAWAGQIGDIVVQIRPPPA